MRPAITLPGLSDRSRRFWQTEQLHFKLLDGAAHWQKSKDD